MNKQTYSKCGADPYTVERLVIQNGKVVDGYIHIYCAEFDESYDPRQNYYYLIGKDIAEIETLRYRPDPNPDVIRMLNG